MKYKMWDEELERGDGSFLELEKKFYPGMFPHKKRVFENNDGNEAAL